jgi:hypothetical protein
MIRKIYVILTPVVTWCLFHVSIYLAFTGRYNSLVLLLLAVSTIMATSGIFLFVHLWKKEKLKRNWLCFGACLFDIVLFHSTILFLLFDTLLGILSTIDLFRNGPTIT